MLTCKLAARLVIEIADLQIGELDDRGLDVIDASADTDQVLMHGAHRDLGLELLSRIGAGFGGRETVDGLVEVILALPVELAEDHEDFLLQVAERL